MQISLKKLNSSQISYSSKYELWKAITLEEDYGKNAIFVLNMKG